jgi:NAD(P)-dependent dehydrogenase (short-subunit alcohol dehydrogenase family)
MTGRLEGKVVIITGATSGIGEATAHCFAAQGARLMLAGRTLEKGMALAQQLGSCAMFRRTDVTREADIQTLVDATIEHFGRLDCMFNNAGASSSAALENVTEQDLAAGMQLLVGSALFGIKHAARVMKQQPSGGSIINNASVAGHRFGQGGIVYSAAKAAVAHLTHLTAVELGAYNIRVNAISPGAIATPIFWGGSARANTLSAAENERKLAKLEQNLSRATPLPRSGHAADIAHAALFLASDEGSFVNGHDLVVDGGRIWQFHERAAAR